MGLGFEQVHLVDPAESFSAGKQEPVVGPDQDVAPRRSQGNRASRGPDAGIDDRDVNPDRQVWQRAPQKERPVADGELPDLVADVDDPGVGRNGGDDPVKDRRRRIARTEVGQQGNEGSSHGRIVAARSRIGPSVA